MKKRSVWLHWLRNLLCGILIGAGAILPGVSGGVLAVVFGIYRPLMEMLTHPKLSIPKYWRWILPLGIGWAAGFLLFAKGIALAMEYSVSVTTWLFIGLIVGTVPQLFHEAGKEGRPRSAWISFVLCGAAMFFSLFYISHVAGMHVNPGFGCESGLWVVQLLRRSVGRERGGSRHDHSLHFNGAGFISAADGRPFQDAIFYFTGGYSQHAADDCRAGACRQLDLSKVLSPGILWNFGNRGRLYACHHPRVLPKHRRNFPVGCLLCRGFFSRLSAQPAGSADWPEVTGFGEIPRKVDFSLLFLKNHAIMARR